MNGDDLPNDPITDVCIVSDPQKCPPNYEMLYKSHDRRDDCDLWKDGLFRSKVTRYVCFCRPATCEPEGNVVTDLVIQSDRELPPSGYQAIEKTMDTFEKATNKKQICIRICPRSTAIEAVSDIIILSKNKRAPIGYTLTGEINGLVICIRLASVSFQHATSVPSCQGTPLSDHSSANSNEVMPSVTSNGHAGGNYFQNYYSPSQCMRQDSTTSISPMFGVPFQLNPSLMDSDTLKKMTNIGPECFVYKSGEELLNEFDYSFTLERTTVLERLHSYSGD